MATLRQTLEKYRNTSVEIGKEDEESYTVSEALECFPEEELDREVKVVRPDEDQSYRFVWFRDSESLDPDFMLYKVPRAGRPPMDKEAMTFTLDKAVCQKIKSLPRHSHSSEVNRILREYFEIL